MRDAISSRLERVICPSNASWAAHASGHCGMRNTQLLCSCGRAASLLLDTVWWHLLLQQKLSTEGVSYREDVDMGWGWSEGLEPAKQPGRVLYQHPTSLPSFPASPAQEGATSTSRQ